MSRTIWRLRNSINFHTYFWIKERERNQTLIITLHCKATSWLVYKQLFEDNSHLQPPQVFATVHLYPFIYWISSESNAERDTFLLALRNFIGFYKCGCLTQWLNTRKDWIGAMSQNPIPCRDKMLIQFTRFYSWFNDSMLMHLVCFIALYFCCIFNDLTCSYFIFFFIVLVITNMKDKLSGNFLSMIMRNTLKFYKQQFTVGGVHVNAFTTSFKFQAMKNYISSEMVIKTASIPSEKNPWMT